jgi:prepilin-type N-terminal cleavage/methylation domain-containing protein
MQTLRKRLSRLSRLLGLRVRAPQRGMTLLEIMIVLAILAIVMGLLVGPRVLKMFSESKVKTTRIKLTQYANEAFPQWSASHPDKACPDKITDLNEYMNSSDANDSWGRPIKMLCGQSLPPGARGLAVMSSGEDGKDGTDDDIKSWDMKTE